MILTINLHLVPRSRMVELYLHPLHLFMSGVQLIKFRDNFTFMLGLWS
jgi:hypothetical protein